MLFGVFCVLLSMLGECLTGLCIVLSCVELVLLYLAMFSKVLGTCFRLCKARVWDLQWFWYVVVGLLGIWLGFKGVLIDFESGFVYCLKGHVGVHGVIEV